MFDDAQMDQLRRLASVSALCSVGGAAFVILSFLLFAETRRQCGRRVLFCLAVADLLASGAWLVDARGDEALCAAQAYGLQVFYLSSFCWTAAFAYHLWAVVYRLERFPERHECRYHLFGWGLPVALALGVFARAQFTDAGVMGDSGRPWCWVSDQRAAGQAWSFWGAVDQVALFYAPVLGIFLFNAVVYYLLARKMSAVRSAVSSDMEARVRSRLVLYLLNFLVTAGWGLAARAYQFTAGHPDSFFLAQMDAAMGPGQGLLNALVYGFNERLRQRWARALCPFSDLSDLSGGAGSAAGGEGEARALLTSRLAGPHEFYNGSGGGGGSGAGAGGRALGGSSTAAL